MNLALSDVIHDPVESIVYTEIGVEEGTVRDPTVPTLQRVLESGVLKVGYNTLDIPFSFRNKESALVGFDIASAYQLARDLDCKLEFIRCDFGSLPQELKAGLYDIAMSAVLMTEERLLALNFTHPYLEDDVVLVVPTAHKKFYLNYPDIESRELKIGAVGEYKQFLRRHFPDATLVPIESLDILAGNWDIDAWMTAKNTGFIWCLSNPNFVTIDYEGLIGKAYFSYPVQDDNYKFISFLNNWLILKNLTGFHKEMYNYWFEGQSPKKQAPRWSILRDVLHVGD